MMHKVNKGDKIEFDIFLPKRSLRIIEQLYLLIILGNMNSFSEGFLYSVKRLSLGITPVRFIK